LPHARTNINNTNITTTTTYTTTNITTTTTYITTNITRPAAQADWGVDGRSVLPLLQAAPPATPQTQAVYADGTNVMYGELTSLAASPP
jgi:hypothetical protein